MRQSRLFATFVLLLAFGGLLLTLSVTQLSWQHFLLLYFAVLVGCSAVLKLINVSATVPFVIPEYTHAYTSASLALIVCVTFYLFAGMSTIWKYIFLALLYFSLYQLTVILFLSLLATKAIASLRKDYLANQLPSMSPPYVLIVSAGTSSHRFLKRTIFAVVKSLLQFHFSELNEEASFMRRTLALADKEVERLRRRNPGTVRTMVASLWIAGRLLPLAIRETLSNQLWIAFFGAHDLVKTPCRSSVTWLSTHPHVLGFHFALVRFPKC